MNDERHIVTSVGNSWIVCKSKSHPGHVYYFNSLTGETAWNLSDAEIEKAKRRTKHLENLPNAKPTKCPEPKDKPPNTPLSNFKKPAQTCSSEKFLINRISEQSSVLTYSNIANSNATFCSPFNPISGVIQGNLLNNSSSIEPVHSLNSFNNSLSTYNLNPTPTFYNPKVWAVPRPPVFDVPGISPVLNHSSGSLNVGYNHLSQTMSQPATGLVFNRFDNGGTQPFFPRDFSRDNSVKRTINKNVGFTNKKDLRQKLSFKKKIYNKTSIPRGSGVLEANSRKYDIATHSAGQIKENDSNNFSTEMESRCGETQQHETPSKIDLGPLKLLSPADANSDAWFIVVDLEVLLHEFKFLTTLTDSDEKCHLMVPKRVIDELKSYVICTENIQAKRILRFLSQQIEIGYAHMAEEPSKVEDDSMAEVIHRTCAELIDINYHLILLTNDNEILNKCSSGINMFRINEIKDLLMKNPKKKPVSSGPKKPLTAHELLHKIKITVPNHAPQNTDTTCPVRDNKSNDNIDNVPIKPPAQNNTQEKKDDLVALKCTADAGIQTDLDDINANISMTNVVDKQTRTAVSNSPAQNTKEVITTRSVSLNIPDKRREIKLKRSISYQPPESTAENTKKRFKWRRRTNTTVQVNKQIQSQNDQDMNTTNVESVQTNTVNEISKLPDQTLNSILESSESNNSAEPKNSTTKENVTVEETSTSGIISNTESNVDEDSAYSISSINQLSVNNEQSNKPMYEIDSITMEKYLKVKCDEWISRFIQIMEEVLSQVLHQEPSFSHTDMPPPWTLHEAAQCIAIKFCGNLCIKVATNNLSEILTQVSDYTGKISMNMTPYQYMQMYSYGVHLLSAIMDVTKSCEDIQIAVDSLSKLLHDIRNPNIEGSTNKAFNDNKHGNISNNDASFYSDLHDDNDDSPLHEQEMMSSCTHVEETRKDDPKTINSSEEVQKPVKFIRNIDIPLPFFKTYLQKSKTLNKVQLPVPSREEQSAQIEEGNNSQNTNQTNANPPSIIRLFRKCPEFEKKLKMKYNLILDDDHNDLLDINESYGAQTTTTENNCPEDENYNKKHHFRSRNQTDGGSDTNEHYYLHKRPKNFDSLLSNESNKKFKFMMYILLQEVREALNQVRILCDQCYKELENPKQSTQLKNQLQEKAERAHLYSIRLCRSFQSMLDHETQGPQSMSSLLKQVDIDIKHVSAELLLKYRFTIAKCKNHAELFVSSTQNIISYFKK